MILVFLITIIIIIIIIFIAYYYVNDFMDKFFTNNTLHDVVKSKLKVLKQTSFKGKYANEYSLSAESYNRTLIITTRDNAEIISNCNVKMADKKGNLISYAIFIEKDKSCETRVIHNERIENKVFIAYK